MTTLSVELATFDDDSLDRMVRSAWLTALVDFGDYRRCLGDFGSRSPVTRSAWAGYQSSEDHWRALSDEQRRRRSSIHTRGPGSGSLNRS